MIDFLNAMIMHRDSSAILIRLAYILGNLTTNFEEARVKLCTKKGTQSSSFKIIIDLLRSLDEQMALLSREIIRNYRNKT